MQPEAHQLHDQLVAAVGAYSVVAWTEDLVAQPLTTGLFAVTNFARLTDCGRGTRLNMASGDNALGRLEMIVCLRGRFGPGENGLVLGPGATCIRHHQVAPLAQVLLSPGMPGSIIRLVLIVCTPAPYHGYCTEILKAFGSIRLPAAFNGPIALRTTYGIASTQGIVPSCKYAYPSYAPT